MNKNDLGIFIENIDFELDKIRNNEAYINNKSYFGLNKELLSYIRNLEQALDEIEKILRQPQFEYDNIPCNYEDDIEKIKEIIQKAKGFAK